MKVKTVYIADDGAQFDTELEAAKYEQSMANKDQIAADKYLNNSYYGQRLAKKHSRSESGTWQIYGEDPNCDFGGHHHTPYLGTVNGTMYDAVKYAVSLPQFYTWGGGGELKKIDVKLV